MLSSYTNPSERSKRVRTIALLAQESHVPIIEVEQLYEEELAILEAGARITRFLSILTGRKVREKLRKSERKT